MYNAINFLCVMCQILMRVIMWQVGTNGLVSFGASYNSFFNQQFPGSSSISFRYLVAPFWDDVDTRGGNGQVYYEVHQSGHFLNQVSSFIRKIKPSSFQGTWMLVVYWDAVHPYFGAVNPEVSDIDTETLY